MDTLSDYKDNILLSDLIEPKSDKRCNVVTCGMRGVDRRIVTSAYLDELSSKKTHTLQTIRLDGNEVELLVWDVPLSSRYRHLTWFNLRKASGVLLCYDVTSYQTFHFVREEWSKHYREMQPKLKAKKMLVGLHCERDCRREVLKTEADDFAINNDMSHLEISLNDRNMIEFLFTGLLVNIMQSKVRNELRSEFTSAGTNHSTLHKCSLM